MEAKRRVTQQDVARAAGVHRATVSLALRGFRGIPAATRKRIARIARRLGYQPDPMLAALASYRSHLRPQGYQGLLAWLANSSSSESDWQGRGWRQIPHFRDYYEGAVAQAARFGYQVEEFNLRQKGMTPGRLASILRARNVSGLLVCPQPSSRNRLDFAWDDFSAVTFGYTLTHPQLHMITATHFRAMVTVMEKLVAQGYRRIGFDVSPIHDRRVGHNYLAGYLLGLELAGLSHEIPPFRAPSPAPEPLREWVARHRLDAVVVGDFEEANVARFAGLRVPRDLGLACPSIGSLDSPMAGIYEDSLHAGEVAVDFLIGMIHRGERGVPASPQRILVEGAWRPGKTLRAVRRARSTV